MTRLPRLTWEVLIGWLLVGLVIYFSYSIHHSKVQKLPKTQEGD
jgi:APA family basic amino acid/polyamine antiporter